MPTTAPQVTRPRSHAALQQLLFHRLHAALASDIDPVRRAALSRAGTGSRSRRNFLQDAFSTAVPSAST